MKFREICKRRKRVKTEVVEGSTLRLKSVQCCSTEFDSLANYQYLIHTERERNTFTDMIPKKVVWMRKKQRIALARSLDILKTKLHPFLRFLRLQPELFGNYDSHYKPGSTANFTPADSIDECSKMTEWGNFTKQNGSPTWKSLIEMEITGSSIWRRWKSYWEVRASPIVLGK